MKFNMTFVCEYGNFKLEDCKEFPRKRDIVETAESLDGFGCGRLKQIVIDIKEL